MREAVSYSVIVPSYNESANIGRCLDAVAAAAAGRSDLEVLVVDNGSTDDTVALAETRGARVIRPEGRVSIAALRNLGGREARGRVLLFLDADMEPPADWLATVDAYFEDDTAQVLGFVERIPADAPWFARIWSQRIEARRDTPLEVDYLPGRNICVTAGMFHRVGGFDEGLSTSEDKDFVMRLKAAGAVVMSVPGLDIYHWGYEKTLGELLRKEFWRQSNHVNMVRRHGLRWRLVRFPLVSAGHVLWPAAPLAALVSGHAPLALALLVLWWAPGLALALKHRLSRSTPALLGQFTVLYWLRFTVAGAAVLSELLLGLHPKG